MWAAIFGLGIVSMAPYLPAKTRYISLWYFLGAVVAYYLNAEEPIGMSRLICTIFAGGHLVTGALLISETQA